MDKVYQQLCIMRLRMNNSSLYSYSSGGNVSRDIMVIANPGTGKTHSLANFAVDLLSNGVPGSEIVCLTFTNRATAEMRNRISSMVKGTPLMKEALNIDIMTFHSLCFNLVTDIEAEPRIASSNFLRASLLRTIRENSIFNYGDAYIKTELLPKIENAVRYVKSFNVDLMSLDKNKIRESIKSYLPSPSQTYTDEQILSFGDHFIDMIIRYSEDTRKAGLYDYNDLLTKWIAIPPDKKKVYRWALIDELQDLNEIEFEIGLSCSLNHYMVGDPKQSIFGFQGGSLKNFENFTSSLRADRKILDENYRSTESILNYAKSFYSMNSNGQMPEELSTLRSRSGETGRNVIAYVSDEPEKAAVRLIEQYQDGKVAIIARRNDQIQRIAGYLDSLGVPYASTSTISINESTRSDILRFIRSIMDPQKDNIISALFTPYSGALLSDALMISKKFKWSDLKPEDIKKEAPFLFRSIKNGRSVAGLNDIMENLVLPVSASLGREHFYSALSVQHALQSYFEENEQPDYDQVDDYLSIYNYDEDLPLTDERIILTTVHKAKGLGFDHVIYVPSAQRERISFMDIVTTALLKATKNVDIKDEIRGEDVRVDFVAMTRASRTLDLVVQPKLLQRYLVNAMEPAMNLDSTDIEQKDYNTYARSFSLFIGGKYEEAKSLLSRQEKWLIQQIASYLRTDFPLSYSLVSWIKNPWDFLKSYVFNIREPTRGMSRGSIVHEYAEKMFANEDLGDIPADYRKIVDNLEKVIVQIKSEFNAEHAASELAINLPVGELFPVLTDKFPHLVFKTKLDAVFRSKNGDIIIADYKTDIAPADQYISDHRLQLYIYKMAYSVKYKMDLKKIRIVTAYVNLAGRINTGIIETKLDYTEPTKRKVDNFIEMLKKVFSYKEDPLQFVSDLINAKGIDDNLYLEIRKILEGELTKA